MAQIIYKKYKFRISWNGSGQPSVQVRENELLRDTADAAEVIDWATNGTGTLTGTPETLPFDSDKTFFFPKTQMIFQKAVRVVVFDLDGSGNLRIQVKDGATGEPVDIGFDNLDFEAQVYST